jgi:large conductance mechanosensitive channel
MFKEFKEFAIKGNVLDMAVGIIVGAAFGRIVSSLVGDVLSPPLGLVVGGVDFSKLAFTLRAAQGDVPAVLLKYGAFIQQVVDFAIVAFAIFLVVKAANALKRKQEAAPSAASVPPRQEVLLEEIRDLLAEKRKA